MKRKNLLFVLTISLYFLVLGTINISQSYSEVSLFSTNNAEQEEGDQDIFSSLSRTLPEVVEENNEEKDSGEDSESEDSSTEEKDSGEDSESEDSSTEEKDSGEDSESEDKGTE